MSKLLFCSVYFGLVLQTTFAQTIHWPESFNPSVSKFYVHNEIAINAPPAKVWSVLIAAKKWETYYTGASNIELPGSDADTLTAYSIFHWKTMGLRFVSTVKEYVPNERLSWLSDKKSIQGYHAWLIIPTPQGCRLITDESQNGWLTFFEKTFQGKKLGRIHDEWLIGIKKEAESKSN